MSNSVLIFLNYTKKLFAVALGIEILCISAAEIGEISSFYLFDYNLQGIILGYLIGYLLASFTTFMTILGRFDQKNGNIHNCCSVLEQQSNRGFFSNLITTFKNFGLGCVSLHNISKQPNLKYILKASLIILVTAESVCILTAETVSPILYKHSLLLSIPMALLAGTFAVVTPEAYKKTKSIINYNKPIHLISN